MRKNSGSESLSFKRVMGPLFIVYSRIASVFSLGSLKCEFQTGFILLSVGGSIGLFHTQNLLKERLKLRSLQTPAMVLREDPNNSDLSL